MEPSWPATTTTGPAETPTTYPPEGDLAKGGRVGPETVGAGAVRGPVPGGVPGPGGAAAGHRRGRPGRRAGRPGGTAAAAARGRRRLAAPRARGRGGAAGQPSVTSLVRTYR